LHWRDGANLWKGNDSKTIDAVGAKGRELKTGAGVGALNKKTGAS